MLIIKMKMIVEMIKIMKRSDTKKNYFEQLWADGVFLFG